MMRNNQEKIAVVTGATSGIGRAIAGELADDHVVYALGRNEEALSVLAENPAIRARQIELVDELLEDNSEELGQEAFDELVQLERIDVLVNAAAIARRLSVEQASPEDWRDMFDTNVTVPAELTRRLLPGLRAAQGLVVFINSGAGRGAYPGNAVYAATKHALYAVADALRKEEANNGVRVTTVAPGPVDTPMLKGLTAAAGNNYQPEHYIVAKEVAKAVRTAVSAGPSTQITELQVRPRIELADRQGAN